MHFEYSQCKAPMSAHFVQRHSPFRCMVTALCNRMIDSQPQKHESHVTELKPLTNIQTSTSSKPPIQTKKPPDYAFHPDLPLLLTIDAPKTQATDQRTLNQAYRLFITLKSMNANQQISIQPIAPTRTMATPTNSLTSPPTQPPPRLPPAAPRTQPQHTTMKAHGDLTYVSSALGFYLRKYPSKQDGTITERQVEDVEAEKIERERREKYEGQKGMGS